MYNAMAPITPRPYNTQGQGIKKEDGSNDKAQDSLQQNGRQGQGQQQEGNKKPAPRRKRINIASNQTGRNEGDSVQIGQKSNTPARPTSRPASSPIQRQPVAQPVNQPTQQVAAPEPMQQQAMPVQQTQQPIQAEVQENSVQQVYNADGTPIEADSRPMAATSNKINISQIIKDFRSTMAAIATPDVVKEEAEDYLEQIITHCMGEAPSVNFVQTNLLNAAAIVDKYISGMLEKESKVVFKWLDALFLQRINYRYNDGEVNKAFLVKFPETEEEKKAKAEKAREEALENNQSNYEPIQEAEPIQAPIVQQTQYEPIPQYQQPAKQQVQHVTSPIKEYAPQRAFTQPQPRVKKKHEIKIIPQDNELNSLFIQAKKHVFAHNPSKAMDMFNRALIRAQQIKDDESESKICLEMGRIYDDNNYIVQALSSYNKSLKKTTDNSVKTLAHLSMAQIYDNVNQTESALGHYLTTVSYAGENDNLVAQSTSLAKMANIFSAKSNPQAIEFYEEANKLVCQTGDAKTKGFVSSSTANGYISFKKPEKALSYCADAVKNYSEAKIQDSVAENYKKAAELMLQLKNPAKAKLLLGKALRAVDRFKDQELISEINSLMEKIA